MLSLPLLKSVTAAELLLLPLPLPTKCGNECAPHVVQFDNKSCIEPYIVFCIFVKRKNETLVSLQKGECV